MCLLNRVCNKPDKRVCIYDIITEITRQCIDRGIINSENGIAIDTTHIEANTVKKVPERIMKHLAKKIFKEAKKTDYEIPNYEDIDDHKIAKQTMKYYLEKTMAENEDKAPSAVQEAKEILQSDLFIEQKGIGRMFSMHFLQQLCQKNPILFISV